MEKSNRVMGHLNRFVEQKLKPILSLRSAYEVMVSHRLFKDPNDPITETSELVLSDGTRLKVVYIFGGPAEDASSGPYGTTCLELHELATNFLCDYYIRIRGLLAALYFSVEAANDIAGVQSEEPFSESVAFLFGFLVRWCIHATIQQLIFRHVLMCHYHSRCLVVTLLMVFAGFLIRGMTFYLFGSVEVKKDAQLGV